MYFETYIVHVVFGMRVLGWNCISNHNAVHTFVLKQRDTAYIYIISSTKIISVCTLINPSLYKDAEEKVERGNHTNLQDIAVTVCVHKGSMYKNTQCL